jgi:hypothetical protein
MSRDLTLYAPEFVLDEWGDTKRAMLTEHVISQDGHQIRFFHESFFDYAFARCFSRTGQKLSTMLEASEQHLFRRAQVRQILAFLRDHDPSQYFDQLGELLRSPGIRFHIKRMVFAWLGSLSAPSQNEWEIIEPLLQDEILRRHILPPLCHRAVITGHLWAVQNRPF